MKSTTRIEGQNAITLAETLGLALSKHADPVEDARDGLTVEEAREIAREDASLIYVDADESDLWEAWRDAQSALTHDALDTVYEYLTAGGSQCLLTAVEDGDDAESIWADMLKDWLRDEGDEEALEDTRAALEITLDWARETLAKN